MECSGVWRKLWGEKRKEEKKESKGTCVEGKKKDGGKKRKYE